MPPRPRTPRLCAVDEAKVVNEVYSQLEPALGLIGWAFGVKAEAVAPQWVRYVEFVVRYAKKGHLPPGVTPGDMKSWIVRVSMLTGLSQESIWVGPAGPAFGAALARAHIAQRESVPRHALAALGGVNERRIRQLIEAGDIKAPYSGDVPAVAATEWLKTRGVEVVEWRQKF